MTRRDPTVPLVLVIGDSRSMPFGEVSTSWPEQAIHTLASRHHIDAELKTLCGHFQTAERSLRRNVVRAGKLQPAVVLVAHGGTECLWQFPNYLANPTAHPSERPERPETPETPETTGPVRRARGTVRRLARRVFDRLLAWELPGTESLLELLGFTTVMSAQEFETSLRRLVDGLVQATDAHVLLVSHDAAFQGDRPFNRRLSRKNLGTMRSVAVAAQPAGRVGVAIGHPEGDARDRMLPDGIHFNDVGHGAFGQWIADRVAPLLGSPVGSFQRPDDGALVTASSSLVTSMKRDAVPADE